MRILLAFVLALTGVAGRAADQGVPPQNPPRDLARSAATGTASISGRLVVLGAAPAIPIRRARVSLTGDTLTTPRVTDTDTDGRYRFDALPAGSYRLTAEKPGYVTLEYGARRPFSRPGPIALKDGQAMSATFGLPRGAAVEGRLTNDAGEPAANMIVSAVRLGYGPEGRRPVHVRQARTDDLGRFRVHSLPPGDYSIEAILDPRAMLNRPPPAPGEPSGYARTYYPGTPRAQEARTSRLNMGQEVGNLDFAMTSVPVAQVSVQVLDSTGKPATTASARLQRVGGPPGEIPGFSDPRTPGAATFRYVPPGEYWLMGGTASEPGAPPEYGVTRITVEGQDLKETVRTEPGARIAGSLEVDTAGTPPTTTGLQIVAHELEFELPVPGGLGVRLPPNAAGGDGRFSIPSVVGRRMIRLGALPRGYALKSIWLDGTDISDGVFDFRASPSPHEMRIVITDRTAQVTGTATDERKRSVDDYHVVLFSEDERAWTLRSRFIRHGVPADGGGFALDGLLAGKYLICALDYLEDDAWNDPDVLRRVRSMATPLTLVEGQKQTVTLTVKVLP
jgi:hypothetical protein